MIDVTTNLPTCDPMTSAVRHYAWHNYIRSPMWVGTATHGYAVSIMQGNVVRVTHMRGGWDAREFERQVRALR